MSALRGKPAEGAMPKESPAIPTDAGASDDLSVAEQVFHESMDAFSSGEMDWKSAVEDLASALMAMSPKPGAPAAPKPPMGATPPKAQPIGA